MKAKNFNVPLMNLKGKPFKEPDPDDAGKRKVVMISDAIVNVLMANIQGETVSGEEKMKRFNLGMKIENADNELELTLDEASLVKKLVGNIYGPLYVGQIWTFLEK